LVVDTALEASWAPVNELDGTLGLDGGNSGVDILGDNVTTVHEAASHVLAVAWVALGHHGGRLEDGVGDFSNGQLFVIRLLGGDDGSEAAQDEVDTWVWDQVGLELSDVDVQGTIEAEGSSQAGDELGDQAVQVGVGGALNVQVTAAQVINGFVVEHGGAVSVLQQGVGGQDGVVGLNDGVGDLRRWVDSETQLGLLTVVNGEALQQEGTQTRASTTTDGVEDQEALETSAVISELADAVQAQVNNFFTNGVVTTGVVVGGVFFAGDELLGVEQLAVCAGADLINDGGLQVQHHGAGNVLASASLGEEGVVGIIFDANSLVRRHRTVWLNAMFQTIKFPTCVTNLATSLSNVDGDSFTHCR
jgi:hypothetical protein